MPAETPASEDPGAPDTPETPRPGIKLGPFIFVPEIRRRSGPDPWAHRKGEPRVFALLWCTYLMIGAMTTLFAARGLGMPTALQYQRGSRALLVIGLVGATILWPMTRLSQVRPVRPLRATLVDLCIIVLPLQALVWPMPVLTHWHWEIIAALALLCLGWPMLAGAIIAHALGDDRPARRISAMATALLLAGIAPACIVLAGTWLGVALPSWWLLGSPVTAPFELTASPSGLRPRMTTAEWWTVVAPMILAAALWTALALIRPHTTSGGRPKTSQTPLRN